MSHGIVLILGLVVGMFVGVRMDDMLDYLVSRVLDRFLEPFKVKSDRTWCRSCGKDSDRSPCLECAAERVELSKQIAQREELKRMAHLGGVFVKKQKLTLKE